MVVPRRIALRTIFLCISMCSLLAVGGERSGEVPVKSGKRSGLKVTVGAHAREAGPKEVRDIRGGQKAVPRRREQHSADYGSVSASVNCSKPDPVHVLYTVDAGAARHTSASVYSALKNAKHPGRLRFHIMVPTLSDAQSVCQMFHRVDEKKRVSSKNVSFMCPRSAVPRFSGYQHHLPPDCMSSQTHASACICSSLQFHFIVLENEPALLAKVKQQIKLSMARHSPDRYDELTNIPNFARNWAYEALQPLGIGKVLYIDADTIVKGDLSELWSLQFEAGKAVMIAKSCENKMAKHIDFGNKIVRALIGDAPSCMYNTGVIVMDIDKMAGMNLGDKINDMYIEHEKSNLWREGIQQPAFILALYHQIQSLDSIWNTTGLGRVKPRLSSGKLERAKILHWTGQRKPWARDGNFKSYWAPYAV